MTAFTVQHPSRFMSRAPSNLCRAIRSVANAVHQGRLSSGTQLYVPVQQLSALTCSGKALQHTNVSFARAASSQPLVQLINHQQQQQQQSGSNSSRSWPKAVAAVAAAAGAAAGWAAWYDTAAAKRAQALAEKSNTAGESRTSPLTQAALVSCYAGPLVNLLEGSSFTQPQLQTLAAVITAESASLHPWELVNALWGLAMFGAQLNPTQLQTLAEVLGNNMSQMTVYQAVVAAWALTMLSGSSSGGSGVVWQQLLLRLKTAAIQEYDDAALLYLLHAAMQQAAAAAAAASEGNLGTSPRATEQEVLQQLDGLPKAARAKVAAAYKEYAPLQQYIEGPYLVILHIAKALPSQISAGAAATTAASSSSTGSSSSSTVSAYQAVFGGFSAADAAGAVTVMSDSSLLKKLRRNLYFGWRSEQLLDRQQATTNQVSLVVSRRLNIRELQQPPDVDLLLPTLKAAIFVEDDVSQPSSSSSRSTSHPAQQQQQQVVDSQYLQQCHGALAILMRNRYAAPPGGFHAKSTAGISAAKVRCLQQRGWRVVVLKVSEVEACMKGAGAVAGGRNKARDLAAGHAALEALLRERLRL